MSESEAPAPVFEPEKRIHADLDQLEVFIEAYARSGRVPESAAKAGLSERVCHRLMQRDDVRSAIHRYFTMDVLPEGGRIGAAVLSEIATDLRVESPARVSAARGLTTIAGLEARAQRGASEREPHEMTTAELQAHLDRIERELGARAKVIAPNEPDVSHQLPEELR